METLLTPEACRDRAQKLRTIAATERWIETYEAMLEIAEAYDALALASTTLDDVGG